MSIVITSWIFLLFSLIVISAVIAIRIRSADSSVDALAAIKAGVFVFYICIVISVTVLPIRIPGEIPYDFEYNFNPFVLLSVFYNRGMMVSALENVLLFMPIPILGGIAESKYVGTLKASVLFALLFSTMIELLQGIEGILVIAEGGAPVADITDVIMNTTGGFLGYLVYYFYRKQHGEG